MSATLNQDAIAAASLPSAPSVPAMMITASASGQGKTTVTAALARLHARQGRTVRVFKSGPDFLDPTWLAAASGAPVHSLDLWMTGADDARQRLAEAARTADVILVEGVMGLHDGEPSSADIARRFQLPVLTVIQASAMAQTFGAIAYGLAHYGDPFADMRVLANGVGSTRHADMLRTSLREPGQWAGALTRDPSVSLPERHLGLYSANELPDVMARLDKLADLLAPLPAAQLPPAVRFEDVPAVAPLPRRLEGKTIAVACDDAFRFIYPANVDTLEALGARVVLFSPLRDADLPACDAVWLPGGYPELHAATLAANTAMQEALRRARASGMPMLAECGGMMALFDTLVDKEGRAHEMARVLPGTVRMQGRLAALGHQAVALPWLDGTPQTVRGHTFHYSQTETPLEPATRAVSPRDGKPGEAVYRVGALTASYVHLYFPSNPEAIACLFGG
ncbi:cobyrinate a,c-diamide synthase [Cupriavidus plantarum]|uniref:Hydrogenobyrinic acid a,c-diamide synthase (Glutamine-hydrolysing) /cobyrinate a,c-diamide synthase n=1 Tax=Cupriavidus plantarum TaxID=942865 RepID=A0A316EQF7_9BURK|nr:cobyrinate a,c-diamide synthase [Cupriavidus plantarum]PWK32654.1 hydrogenobyrinic acid a,c-diamide synthase (glutamine-hydrolysing) /cobyrinate a,c-diamide synthase [Cupriavidus plantarum]